MATFNLKDIIQTDRQSLQSLTADVTIEGMHFTIGYLSRAATAEMARRCVTHRWNASRSSREATLDYAKLAKELSDAVVKGWRGVTPSKLAKFLPMKRALTPEELETEIPFDQENLRVLLENVTGLESALQDAANDASLFQPATLEAELGN